MGVSLVYFDRYQKGFIVHNIFICVYNDGSREIWAVYSNDKKRYELHGNEDGNAYLGYDAETMMQVFEIVDEITNAWGKL